MSVRRAWWLAPLVCVALAACGSSPQGVAASGAPVAPSSGTSASAVAPATPSPTDSATAQPEPSFTGPDFHSITSTPAQTKPLPPSNSTPTNGYGYALSVVKSGNNVWEAYLHSQQLAVPRMNFDIMSPGDASQTRCHDNLINQNYPAMLYCAADTDGQGRIFIPMDLLARQWGGVDRKTGDLTAAITVSRLQANLVITSLGDQLGVSQPTTESRTYIGACLSGAWGHAVWPAGTYTEKQQQVALERATKAPFQYGSRVVAANTDALTTAWVSGYTTGLVGDCLQNFWR